MNQASNENIEKKRPIWVKLFGAIILVFILLFIMNSVVKKEVSSLIKNSQIPQEAQHSTAINSNDK